MERLQEKDIIIVEPKGTCMETYMKELFPNGKIFTLHPDSATCFNPLSLEQVSHEVREERLNSILELDETGEMARYLYETASRLDENDTFKERALTIIKEHLNI